MGRATIETTPPVSLNRGGHWTVRHKRKRQAEGELAILLLAAGVPRPIPGDRLRATAELLFPTARRRDEGNYRTALEKALGDALCPHDPEAPFRWLSDDTPEHFTFGAVTFGLTDVSLYVDGRPRRRPAIARITLSWGEDLVQDLRREVEHVQADVNLEEAPR